MSLSSVTRIGTTDGSLPPGLKSIVFQFDQHGTIETKGVPACTMAKLAEVSSPLSFFNAPPVGGKPSLIAHAYETVPSPKTLLVPIVVERSSTGATASR